MYAVTALPVGPHAAPAADETGVAASTPAAPDAASAATSGGAAGAAPAGGEPASEASAFGDVLQREQQGAAPADSSVATPAQSREARHHDPRRHDADSPAAVPAAAVPLLIAVAASPTTALGPLALRPRGAGDSADGHAKSGDDQGTAASRLGSGQERGYAASGTGTAQSPERTVTLSTSMESQPQMPMAATDALAAAGTTARQAAGAASAPQVDMGRSHEEGAAAKGRLNAAQATPVADSLNIAPAAPILAGTAASTPAHAAEADVVVPDAPAATETAAGEALPRDRAASTVQLDATIAAAVADLATAAGAKLLGGAAAVAAPRTARDRAAGSGQAQKGDVAPTPARASAPDGQARTAQPHGAQTAGSPLRAALPHATTGAAHESAGDTPAHTDPTVAGVGTSDVPHSEAAPPPGGQAAAGRGDAQQGVPAAMTAPAGLSNTALPASGNVAPGDRAGSNAASGERSTPAPVQHGASRHDAAPALQGAPTGSAAALQATTPPGAVAPIIVPGGRLPAAGVRASGVETALHRVPDLASGPGADSSIMPLRGHTAAPAASASTPFALPQAMSAVTGTAPAHHAVPKEAAAAGGVLAPVAEGIFVRLGALRTTPSSSSFHVVLQPQALGTVSVHVERGQDGLQVTLIPQQSATREILDRHMHELVSALGTADGVAPRVSVAAPGAASSGNFTGADQGMLGGGGFSADSGGQQPFQGQGAQGEPSSWDDTGRPSLTPAPVRAPAASRAPLTAQRPGNASRVDFQA